MKTWRIYKYNHLIDLIWSVPKLVSKSPSPFRGPMWQSWAKMRRYHPRIEQLHDWSEVNTPWNLILIDGRPS